MLNYKDRTLDRDKPVEVYRNLGNHVDKLWSIRQNGLVIGHTDRLMLRDVEFVVSEAGQKRVREEQRKNVHAFIRGVWTTSGMGISHTDNRDLAMPVTYNPYKDDGFRMRRPPYEIVKKAWCVKFNDKKVTYSYGRTTHADQT